MRLIHTADWHLGRIFFSRHLTDDQEHVLDQFVDLVERTGPDAVLIAGDVYDRAIPPIDAVRLLNRILSHIVRRLGVPVFVIAGNHDSAERLEFGSDLLRERNLFISGSAAPDAAPVLLHDEHGPIAICPLPFCEPALVRARFENDSIHDHQTALAAVIAAMGAQIPDRCRSVALAHAFVTGAESSESERPLMVGGSANVSADLFDRFDYVALGHLHKPQSIKRNRIRYSGSLLKYSFSEASHAKSVDIVEIDARGAVTIEPVGLKPLHDVRQISGHLADLVGEDEDSTDGVDHADGARNADYLMVTVEDRGAQLDLMGKLRTVFPNVLHIERPLRPEDSEAVTPIEDRLNRTEEEIFSSFFKEATGKDLSDEEGKELRALLDGLRRAEREASS